MSTATSSSRFVLSSLAVLALCVAGANAAPPQAMPDTENGRYALSSTPDGVLRLDTRTGAVSTCSNNNGAGWACYAVPDERAAMDAEIGRLQAENAKLKAQLASREFPGSDARQRIAVRRTADQVEKRRVRGRAAQRGVRRPGEHQAERAAHQQAPHQRVETEHAQLRRPRGFHRQFVKRAPAQPGTELQFDEQQRGRKQRIRDVRRQVHLQAVQPQQPSADPAEQQMKSEEWQAADEDADANRRGFAASAAALGSQLVEQAAHARGHRGHPDEDLQYMCRDWGLGSGVLGLGSEQGGGLLYRVAASSSSMADATASGFSRGTK